MLAARAGDVDKSMRLHRRAYMLEKRAALDVVNGPEPTRSVLLRSAATLACICGENEEAADLISIAFEGTPHAEIAAELWELVEQMESP